MDLQKFFASIRKQPFGGRLTADQVRGTEAILASWDRHGDGDLRKLATILANVKHETAHTMLPVRETLASTDAEAVRRLDAAWAGGRLPGVVEPYWRTGYWGRGHIQLTHLRNYDRLGQRLKVGLSTNPSLALDMAISADIAVVGMMEGLFTGKRLSQYFDAGKADWRGSRAIVNGDVARNGAAIAASAQQFHAALVMAGAGSGKTVPEKPAVPVAAQRGLWGALAAAGAAVAGWFADLPLPALIVGCAAIAAIIILALHRWSK